MTALIGSIAYVAVVLTFVLHLILDHRFRQRLCALERQHYRLRRTLEAMSRQDNWVVANSAFSHAPWVLVCLSGSYYRTAARHLDREDLESDRELLTAAVAESSPRPVYRHCFDLYGFFGDVGSFGSLKDLSDDGCKMLKLSFPVKVNEGRFTESPPVVDPVITPVVCEPTVEAVVEPELVRPVRVTNPLLPPLFSSRFR